MAIDNLNYYSAWLPAGQQTDRYSSQPWCLRSKNLDIFSSSKSVKATAWSEPTTTGSDIIKQDGNLMLKTDGKVYDISTWEEVLVVDPSINFPSYQVSYNWKNGTFSAAQRWTPQDLVTKYEWDELKAFTVFTDRASYAWSSVKYVIGKSFSAMDSFTLVEGAYSDGYRFNKSDTTSSSWSISIKIENPPFTSFKIRLLATENASDNTNISVTSVILKNKPNWYYYDAQLEAMTPLRARTDTNVSFSWNITDWIIINVPAFPYLIDYAYLIIYFKWTKKDASGNYWWNNGHLFVDINWWPEEDRRMTINGVKSDWDYDEYYGYLPIRNRKLVSVWDYGYSESFWMKGTSFQPLYKWTWSWIEVNWEKKVRYDFVTDMWWETDVSMDIIWMMIWNEQVYMIGNMWWNGYIIPCDLTGGRWTPYIAYGCEFKWVTNIDYLLYLVWEDRWVSQLWVYNGQELVSILWWNKESEDIDLVGVDEQYKFDWKMVEYRGNLVLTTTDGRIFEYWQTYGGKWGAFVHQLPADATITWLNIRDNDLIVSYSITDNWVTTKYNISYQDDISVRNYNTEWEAVYPIVLWNHLLEKEESDLYASYILPSSDCSLEFWASANHYHFWTFKTDWSFTPTVWSKWMIDGTDFNYYFEFIEANWERLTFRLVWDLPAMTGQETMVLTEFMSMLDPHYISYTEFNHFRKIWEITTTGYQEWEIRFHNLNNKLELPKSHSLQVMVRGKGSQTYTPELFALDLVANQRERW